MVDNRMVHIEIRNRFSRIAPADVAPLLMPHLTLDEVWYLPGGPLGHERAERTTHLCWPDGQGALLVPTGLVARVQDILGKAGYEIVIVDRRCLVDRAQAEIDVLQAANNLDRPYLDVLVREPKGVIAYRSRTDLIHRAAQLCRLFPCARIYFRLATRKHVCRFRRLLQETLRQPVDLLATWAWPWEGGRLVGTLHRSRDPRSEDFDVLVYVDAAPAVSTPAIQAINEFGAQRVYCLLPHGMPLGRNRRLYLEAFIGPVIFSSPDPRGPKAEVLVHWSQPPWSPPLGEASELERKRRGIWHNGPRNDVIAAVAQALCHRDMPALWTRGLFLDEEAEATLGAQPAVVVLMESTEHGRQLLQRLPGWQFFDARPRRLSGADSSPARRQLGGGLDRTIITLARAHREAWLVTDVLVRADGLAEALDIPGFPPRQCEVSRGVLCIDVADDGDPSAMRATRARLMDYDRRGWKIIRVPASVQRGRPTQLN